MKATVEKKLPKAVTYEEGLAYWPYRDSLNEVLQIATNKAVPKGARVLDMMCGPGWLLGKIHEKRPDLELTGVDIDQRYVHYGRRTHKGIAFERGNVLRWKPKRLYDLVLCTGALHHIIYTCQDLAVEHMATMVRPGGRVVISDCYVDDYNDEIDRKLAAAKLGYEYLHATIANGAPYKVIQWTIDILHNDVFCHEYKTSIQRRDAVFARHFAEVKTTKAWPPEPKTLTGYGDYIHVCTPA